MRLKKRGECRGTTYFPFANLYRIIPRVLWCIKVSRQPTPIVHNSLPALICSHIKPAACKLGCHIWASNIAPHDFRAHISKRVSFWEYHICDIILYIDKTSVGQCHIGIRICGVAARPIAETVFGISWVEPLRQRKIWGAMELRLVLSSAIKEFLVIY
jgi:hypothetical protein